MTTPQNSHFPKPDEPSDPVEVMRLALNNPGLTFWCEKGSTSLPMCRFDLELPFVRLHKIATRESDRDKGQARQMLHLTCRAADELKVTLELEVLPQEQGIDQDRLVKWYRSEGFEFVCESDEVNMRRSPFDNA